MIVNWRFLWRIWRKIPCESRPTTYYWNRNISIKGLKHLTKTSTFPDDNVAVNLKISGEKVAMNHHMSSGEVAGLVLFHEDDCGRSPVPIKIPWKLSWKISRDVLAQFRLTIPWKVSLKVSGDVQTVGKSPSPKM